MTDLSGKVALVTGGAAGIGEACARALAGAGASVVIADLALDVAKAVASAIGGLAIETDGVGNKDRSRVADLPASSWRKVLDTNLDGVFFSVKAEIPAMIASGGGSIINMASVMGAVAVECGSAYVTAKHGVIGLTKAAALDHAAENIRVNAVGPGYVDTPMLADRTDEQRAEIAARHPLNRIATPEDVAAMVLFLASPAAAFVTGAYYPVDGGYLAR
jgi:2-dehydro-3-deoxy-L-rhamnonate dehydrogenase (NAD+)